VRIEPVVLEAPLAEVLGAEPGAEAMQIARVVLQDGTPMALMVDTVHPSIALPPAEDLRAELEAHGSMVLDVLTGLGVPVAFSNTSIRTSLVGPGEPAGVALGVTEPTAILALDEIFRVTSGQVTHHSRDLFAPAGIDLRVVRWVEARRPDVVGASALPTAPAKRRSAPRRSRRR
jgi:DNA-binding GntR family transcriptional regulator